MIERLQIAPTVLLAACLISCSPSIHQDASRGFVVRQRASLGQQYDIAWMTQVGSVTGDAGPIHPAVLEYVLSTQESPWTRYYAALKVSQPSSIRLSSLNAVVSKIVPPGQPPTARDYARAAARAIGPYINAGLVASHTTPAPGTVVVECCATVDPDQARIQPLSDSQKLLIGYFSGFLLTWIVRNKAARFIRVLWRDDVSAGDLSWDLSRIPGAFSTDSSLDIHAVAKSIVAMHKTP